MNSIFQKSKNIYQRLSRGFQVAFIPERFYLYQRNIYNHHHLSYSQEGEDMILSRFFEHQIKGFYVDIGAHHPQRFSNTYKFYLQGWRGINIDAMPGSMKIFNQLRPNDINLEISISDQHESLTYYSFNEPALNGFCPAISDKRDGFKGYKIIEKYVIQTYTLSEILDKYLPPNQKIDFLTVDVEGLDLKVLASNNWERYRPKLVLVEDLHTSLLSSFDESKLGLFMYEQGYKVYAKSVNTMFFLKKD